jgi:hypothetical protein
MVHPEAPSAPPLKGRRWRLGKAGSAAAAWLRWFMRCGGALSTRWSNIVAMNSGSACFVLQAPALAAACAGLKAKKQRLV